MIYPYTAIRSKRSIEEQEEGFIRPQIKLVTMYITLHTLRQRVGTEVTYSSTAVQAVVVSRLDYCNSALKALPQINYTFRNCSAYRTQQLISFLVYKHVTRLLLLTYFTKKLTRS